MLPCHGYTVLTVAQDVGTTNYTTTTPETVQCLIHITVPSLENTSWDRISAIAQAGEGSLYWDIGDTKTITLNGKVGDYLTLNNYQCKVFILHFNLPDDKIIPQKNIIFGGFKKADTDTNIFLADSLFWTGAHTKKGFNMNHYDYVSNHCWSGTELRYDVLGAVETPPPNYGTDYRVNTWWPNDTSVIYDGRDLSPREGADATTTAISNPVANTLMAALPAEFRTVLKLWNRYFDKGGDVYWTPSSSGSNTKECHRHWETAAEDIVKIVDAGVSLLSEFEIFGSCIKANPYEQEHQTYLDYYAQGGPIYKTYHEYLAENTSYQNHPIWWLASLPYIECPSGFLTVYMYDANYRSATHSYGLAPIFKV